MAWGRVVDAVLIARELHNHFEQNGGAETLNGRPHAIKVNPQLLKLADARLSVTCGRLFRTTMIKSRELNALQGVFMRYETGGQILLNHTLNLCWTRLVACKEIMHLYCDTDVAHFATDILKQLSVGILRTMPQSPNDEIESEDAAILAAIEFLYPWHSRVKTTDGSNLTRFQIADMFKIPEAIVDRYFLSGYGALSESINSGLA